MGGLGSPVARAQTAQPSPGQTETQAPAQTQTPPPAQPPPPGAPDEAKTIYERALSLYALGRYAEAAPLFERAFELKPIPALLYNAAQAHRLAGHAERAVTLYESYLHLYGDPSRKAEIEAHIAELKSAIAAHEHATTAPPTGAEVPAAGPTASGPSSAPAAAPSSETLTASAPAKPKPLLKRPWFWAAVGGGALVIAGVVVGIVVGTRGHVSPPASFGTVNGN